MPDSLWAESLLRLGASLERLKKKIGSLYSTFLFSVALALRKANFLAEILALSRPLAVLPALHLFLF